MATKNPPRKPAKQTPEPEELLLTELREIHNAESQFTRALPQLTRAVRAESVRGQFERRLEEGRRLLEDLDKAFDSRDATPGRKKNVAAEGLIQDAQEHVRELESGPALDAVLIGAVQKVEHYCIASWGTARAFAAGLREQDVVKAMDRALQEGRRFDDDLTSLAVDEINPAMLAEAAGSAGSRPGSEPGARA
jgi:ferritin-like metal-binding protein YciE